MHTLLFVFLLSGETVPRIEETIVVTGERLQQPLSETAAALTVLARADLQSVTATHLGEVLRLVPGLQIVAVDGLGTPMISSRGFFGAGEVEYVQLIVDGAPAGDVESGNGDWRSLAIDSIDRVEILRGAGSSMFGDTALGGVVQVFRRPRTRVALSAGSFETVGASATLADDRFHAAFSTSSIGGFRAHSSGREINGSASLRTAPVRFRIDVVQREREEPGPLTADQLESDPFGSDPMFRSDRDETRRVRLAATAGSVVAHAHRRESNTVRTLLLAPGFGDRATRRLESAGGGLTASHEWSVGPATRFATGADLSRDALHTRYAELDASDGHRLRAAIFAAGEWRATSRLRITAGARWDRIADDFDSIDRTDDALSPRLGLAYEAGEATAWINLSRSFKVPTLEQRFDPRPFPDFAGGTFTISNGALLPQTATALETGARGTGWEVVAYEMRVDDEIDFDVATFRYANIGRSVHRGVEAAFRLPAGRRVRPAISYSWTRVEPLDGPYRGRQLKNIAEHLLRGSLHIRMPLEVAVAAEHLRGRFLDDANRFPLDDSTVIDLALSRAMGTAKIALHVRNLFDERYAPLGFSLGDPYYFPAAGRSFAATVSWQPDNGGL